MEKNLNLKIYGVTTVGPKGQVIIPKEIREEYNIIPNSELGIAMVEKTAFGIGVKTTCKEGIKKNHKNVEDLGIIKIGTKYQFVIPCSIRKELKIDSGDSLIVIGKTNEGIGFIKNDRIEFLIDFIRKQTS